MKSGTLANAAVLGLLALGFAGVATEWRLPWRKTAPPPAAKADWCAEHDMPESSCYI